MRHKFTMSLHQNAQHDSLEAWIAGELVEALDLKNAEVAALNKRVDTYVKQVGMLERKQMMVQMRRKVRK